MMKKLTGISQLLFFIFCFCQNSIGQTKEEQKNYQHFSDSIRAKIDFDKKNDSTAFYKNESSFRYIENLDSLLRTIQNKNGQEITKEKKINIGSSSDYSGINKFLSSKPVTIILWIIVISFALFILYTFIYKTGFFKNGHKTKPSREMIPDILNDKSVFRGQLISQENAQMYNDAVRLLFLITLNEMSDKRLLHFSADKTNRDYLIELKDPAINKEFAALVKTFEYCWYGKFIVTEARYAVIKNSFIQFNHKLL